MSEREIFLAVIDLPTASERGEYLHKACGTDRAMRGRIESLLRSHEDAGSFLGNPAVAPPDLDNASTAAFSPTADQKVNADEDEIPLGFLAPATRPDSLGRIGHYEVLQVLGQGGFGIVFRAFDDILQRVVAVKVLSPQMAATSPARKRFLREARSSAQVRHENVVQVYEVGEQPLPYIAMEYIPGETLQQRLNRTGPIELIDVVQIGKQIAEGLNAAHANDLIHRDIKPGNILLEGGAQKVKITDFGLARAADDASISQSGIIAGTPMFMAPEQAKGEKLDHRADLFSLGSVLYQMAAGRPPFRANGTLAVLKRVAEDDPRPIREIIPEVPQWLCDIISKLHAKKPDERYQSAREVADVLADCEAQLKENAKLKDYSRIPKSKQPAAQKAGKWKRVAAAVFLLPVIALALTEVAGVTRLFRGHTTEAPTGAGSGATGRDSDALVKTDNVAFASWADAFSKLIANSQRTDAVGSKGGSPFEDVPSAPALLVGLAGSTRASQGGGTIRSLQPIYLTADGIKDAQSYGSRDQRSVWRVVAKEGYAVGGMVVISGLVVDGFKIVFMRIDGAQLNPKDRYESDWVGGHGGGWVGTHGGGTEISIGGDGRLVVGIHGRCGESVDSLGLVQLDLNKKELPPPVAAFGVAQAKELQEAWAKKLGVPVEYTNSLGMKFRLVPPGTFIMGSSKDEIEHLVKRNAEVYTGDDANWNRDRIVSEGPAHEVEITKPFYLGSTPVTFGQFRKFVEAEKYAVGSDSWEKPGWDQTDDHPVVAVSRRNANDFCGWLSKADRQDYRLPTEAEWEYACRAGTTTRYWFGDDDGKLPDHGWFKDNAKGQAQPVGNFPANPWGLFDLYGNVFQWCGDLNDQNWYAKSPKKDPVATGDGYLVRGGTWQSPALACRSAARNCTSLSHQPGTGDGFRVLLSVDAVRQTLFTDADVKRIAALPAAEQVEEVRKELMRRNPDFDGKVEHKIDDAGVVTEFRINTDKVTDISPIRVFNALRVLDCHGTWTDKANGQLADLTPLKGMNLDGLTQLNLGCTKVTDAGLAYFKDCKNLRGLYLDGTKVTDAGMVYFKDCKTLAALRLDTTQVRDPGLVHFQGCKDLTSLDLRWSKVGDAGLAHFKDAKELTMLLIDHTQATDLSLLKGMPLKELSCDFLPERDAEILRSIKTLEKINGKPVAEFWKDVNKE